jgi:catechol 2,3-dioxygenase-like lactoylglutathione lyase family enzyme
MSSGRRVAQIALATSDRARSTAFYRDVFQLRYIFETAEFRGPEVDKVQGMERVASSTAWLMDNRDVFQLELFEFENPQSRPLPEDQHISDEGYNRVIIAVRSLQSTVDAAVACGARMLHLPEGAGTTREPHMLLEDPDGILLELVEASALVPANRSAQIVGLGLTTLDLATSVEDFCDGFGLEPCEDRFDHVALWNENGRLEHTQTLRLEDMYLVLSQYRDGRPRRSGHRLADIGVMNFAVSFPDAADFDACFARTTAMGMRPNAEPMIVDGKASVAYHNDRQGCSVEMIYMDASLRGLYGFAPPSLKDRLINKLLNWRSRRIYRKHLAQAGQPSEGEKQ